MNSDSGISPETVSPDAGHHDLAKVANPTVSLAKRQAVAGHQPEYGNNAGNGETLHQHGEHVLVRTKPP